VSIFPHHEAKALLELFCLQPIVFGWRQNSSSSSFASWDKIKIPDFTLADQAGSDWWFSKICGQDWIGFNFVRSGLDSDWKIAQSAHLCKIPQHREAWRFYCENSTVWFGRKYLVWPYVKIFGTLVYMRNFGTLANLISPPNDQPTGQLVALIENIPLNIKKNSMTQAKKYLLPVPRCQVM